MQCNKCKSFIYAATPFGLICYECGESGIFYGDKEKAKKYLFDRKNPVKANDDQRTICYSCGSKIENGFYTCRCYGPGAIQTIDTRVAME